MPYLKPSDYVAFGLSADTSDAWIAAASAMIDAYCKRTSLGSATYAERLRVSRGTGTAQLSYGPVIAITALRGRYAHRTDHLCAGLLEAAQVFCLPGQWVDLDPSTAAVDAVTGEIAVASGLFSIPYSELEVTYTAGSPEVPDAVKFACAQIVRNAQATPGFNVKSSKLDTLQTEYFSDSLLDSQVRAMLRPFVAERLG